MQILGEDGAVFLVLVKPLRAGLGMAVTLPACRHNSDKSLLASPDSG